MKVLIIDDEIDSVKGIRDFCKDKNWDVEIVDFKKVYRDIIENDPDIIVLDWRKDAENIGDEILSNIWRNGFRPIVIFSANESIISIDDKIKESSILKKFSKGDETPVTDYLCENEKFVNALSSYRREMSTAMIKSLNVLNTLKAENYPGDDVISYMLSKRTATFFDIQYKEGSLPLWSQYIYPPVALSLCVCDIIRVITKDTDYNSKGNPEEYKIVLTPSCDIVSGRPKVSKVVCAQCFPKEYYYNSQPMFDTKDKKECTNLIRSCLNQGYNQRWLALPEIKPILPYMTADLKKIELIDFNKIALNIENLKESDEFVRVVSIDSPFREQIVWAFMQNSCRPGVPDRDTNAWAKELMEN